MAGSDNESDDASVHNEHIAVQRESKARTTLLRSILDDHVADFHYMDDVALTLKTKCGLELLSFDDLYYKLKTFEVDVKGYTTFSSSQSAGLSHSAFVSTTSASKKMSYGNSLSYSSTTTCTAPSNSKTGCHRFEKLDLEEMDLQWKMAMLFVRVHKFEQKSGRKIDFDKKESARFNKKKVRCYKCQQRGHFARECRAKGQNDKQRYSSFKIKEIEKKEEDLKALITVDTCDTEDAIEEGAAKIYNLITGADIEEASTAGEFALMGVTSEVHNCPFSCDNKTKVGLGFNNYISKNELGWDDSAFSVFTTNSKDVKGRPLFNRFAKTDSMKAVPPPLSRDYTSLSDHIDLDESQISYGKNSIISSDSKSVSNDFVSCDDSNKSSEVNTNDFASSDSSVKSSEPKPNDSTCCASTFSVSTSENEAEIESKVGTPIQEPIIVQDLPSFSCNSFDKNENTSRTSCNKNGYFNKKADGQLLLSPQQVVLGNHIEKENPFPDAKDEGVFDSGCSRSMTGNKERLDDFQELQQSNLFSISQICDKKNRVLFTNTECLVLSKDFKLPNESMVVLRVPRKHNLYTINLNNLCPRGNLACLVAHASVDEYVKWHRRMGHVNYKSMNRLVKGNLVRGLPPKLFKNDYTCVACCKGKQHKAFYKAINAVSSISEPLQLLHIDLFGPTSIRSIDHKYYSLVITDDYSRFCWVFFLKHKDETYLILKDFINLLENQLNKKVKAMRCDNGTEFKNAHIIKLCGSKGIKREYSNARTPQQNRVAERKNRTLKETPYALLSGNIPSVSHFKPFGCHVTILNTSDHLGKFDGNADEGYIVGYSASNKPYSVYNVPNKRVEETMNLRYLEEKSNVQGLGHEGYFDLNYLIDTLGYKHDKANQSAGTQEAITNPAGTQDTDSDSDYDEQVIIVPSYPSHNIKGTEPTDTFGDEVDDSPLNSADEIFQKELARLKGQEQRATSDAARLGLGFANNVEELQKRASVKTVPPGSIPVSTGSIPVPAGNTMVSTDDVPVHTSSSTNLFFNDEPTTRFPSPSDLGNHALSPGIFSYSSYDDEFGAALNNVASTVEISPVATTRINAIHPQSLIIGD
nr:putative ribonuclease H-like domain-containing protein [Tanacetum cinerariifolium]